MTTLKEYCDKYNIKFNYKSGSSNPDTHFQGYPVVVPKKAQDLFNLQEIFFILEPSLYYINHELSLLLVQTSPQNLHGRYCICGECVLYNKNSANRQIILTPDMVDYLEYGQTGQVLDDTCIKILTRKMGISHL